LVIVGSLFAAAGVGRYRPAPAAFSPPLSSDSSDQVETSTAYVQGVSTRSVDDLVRAMGMSGVSKSQVSRLCEEIDERVTCRSLDLI